MEDFKLQTIREKYDDYKEILTKVENGEYNLEYQGEKVTVYQLGMMKEIVDTLEDMSFHKIIKPIN